MTRGGLPGRVMHRDERGGSSPTWYALLTPGWLLAGIVMAKGSARSRRWLIQLVGLTGVAAVILGVVACGGSDDAEPQGTVSADSVKSLSGQDIVAVPITEPTRPSAFPGDDDEFLRRAHEYLDEAEVTTQIPPDLTMVTIGR